MPSNRTQPAVKVFLRGGLVSERTGLSEAQIREAMTCGEFPEARQLEGEEVWEEALVAAWCEKHERPMSPKREVALNRLIDVVAGHLVEEYLQSQDHLEEYGRH